MNGSPWALGGVARQDVHVSTYVCTIAQRANLCPVRCTANKSNNRNPTARQLRTVSAVLHIGRIPYATLVIAVQLGKQLPK